MKKIILFLLVVLLQPISVNAIHEVIDARCTNDIKTSLREDANDIVYRLSRGVNGNDISYTLYFYNLTENIYLTNEKGEMYLSSEINNLKPGSKLTVYIYASDKTYCNGYKSLTKIINVPYYNPYFTSELCSGYENYSLCKEHVNVTLTQEEFIKKLNEYKNSLKKEEQEVTKPIIENKITILDILLEYKYYLLGSIALISILIIYIVLINKKKNRGIL